MRRGQGQLELQHQAIGAPHVVHQQGLGAAQFHELGFRLDGDGLQAKDVAPRGQRPVVDGTHAAEATAEQTTQGGAAVGGRHAAHLQAAGSARLLLEVRQAHAGLRPARAAPCPKEALVAAHVQHHATVQRHRLAVVARARAADGDGHLVLGAGRHDAHDLVFRARAHGGFGRLARELALEHGAEPGEVLRQAGHARLVRHPVQIGQGMKQGFNGLGRSVHEGSERWTEGGPKDGADRGIGGPAVSRAPGLLPSITRQFARVPATQRQP